MCLGCGAMSTERNGAKKSGKKKLEKQGSLWAWGRSRTNDSRAQFRHVRAKRQLGLESKKNRPDIAGERCLALCSGYGGERKPLGVGRKKRLSAMVPYRKRASGGRENHFRLLLVAQRRLNYLRGKSPESFREGRPERKNSKC